VAHRVHSGSPAAKVRGVRLGNPDGARALPGKQVGNADVMAKINANTSLRLRTSRALSRPKEPQGSRLSLSRGVPPSVSKTAFKISGLKAALLLGWSGALGTSGFLS
jgi:hypothetical protein